MTFINVNFSKQMLQLLQSLFLQFTREQIPFLYQKEKNEISSQH